MKTSPNSENQPKYQKSVKIPQTSPNKKIVSIMIISPNLIELDQFLVYTYI